MNIEEFWSGYTSSEQELFQKSCRRLLKQTFIVRDKDQIDKSTMTGILALFSRYQLLQMMGKIGDEDCRIALLPSMQFALNMDEFTNFVSIAEKRMKQKWNDSDEDEEEPDGEIVD